MAAIPRNAREVFAPPGVAALLYRIALAFADLTGWWTFPAHRQGDVAKMRFVDKVYWLSKAARPTRRARRNSGLEAYFAQRAREEVALPSGFEATDTLTVSSAGDLMNHSWLTNSGQTLYPEVAALLFEVDLSMANLECMVQPSAAAPLVITGRGGPLLAHDKASFEVASGTAARRFDLLSLANNHTLDFGEAGVDETVRQLETRGIACAGVTARGGDPDRVTVLERGRLRIGVVAFTFGVNGKPTPTGRPHVVHRMLLNEGVAADDFTRFKQQAARARAAQADLLLVHLHWGLEHEYFPIPEQLELAHHLAELGADAIIGHHAHVVQPMELYRTTRDPHRLVPIYYSLGNLINPFSDAHVSESGVARMSWRKGSFDGGPEQTYLERADLRRVKQVGDPAQAQLKLVPC